MPTRASSIGTARRATLVAAGTLSVGLGAIGIVVPGLPTTVFLLIASYCFARSSPRLHRRLLEHPRFGPFLEMARSGAMPLRAKLVSLAAMWAGIGAACLALSDRGPLLPATVALAGAVGTAVLVLWIDTAPTTAHGRQNAERSCGSLQVPTSDSSAGGRSFDWWSVPYDPSTASLWPTITNAWLPGGGVKVVDPVRQ